jgi:hypothetical protein
LQKALESANIKLQSVVTDITGVSATEMLAEMLAGNKDPKQLAEVGQAAAALQNPAIGESPQRQSALPPQTQGESRACQARSCGKRHMPRRLPGTL